MFVEGITPAPDAKDMGEEACIDHYFLSSDKEEIKWLKDFAKAIFQRSLTLSVDDFECHLAFYWRVCHVYDDTVTLMIVYSSDQNNRPGFNFKPALISELRTESIFTKQHESTMIRFSDPNFHEGKSYTLQIIVRDGNPYDILWMLDWDPSPDEPADDATDG